MNQPTAQAFTPTAFWRHVRKYLVHVPFLKDALAMFYATQDAKTPLWVKGTIAAALAYFALPMDAIPEVVFFGLGFTDDAAVVLGTLRAVAAHVTDEHRGQAERWLAENA